MIDEIVRHNTLVTPEKLNVIRQCLLKVKHLDGEVAEIGVYRGGSARLICQYTDKKVFLIDTFSGLPKESPHDNACKQGYFANTSVSAVKNVLAPMQNYRILVQNFPKDTFELDIHLFKFVHIDVDIYSSTLNCLNYFWPKMVKGGYIVIDDYLNPLTIGVKQAVNEFCAVNKMSNGENISARNLSGNQGVITSL